MKKGTNGKLTFKDVYSKEGGNNITDISVIYKASGIKVIFNIPLEYCTNKLPELEDLCVIRNQLLLGNNFTKWLFKHNFHENNLSYLQIYDGSFVISDSDEEDCDTCKLVLDLDDFRDDIISLFTKLIEYKKFQIELHKCIDECLTNQSDQLFLRNINGKYIIYSSLMGISKDDLPYITLHFNSLTKKEYDDICQFNSFYIEKKGFRVMYENIIGCYLTYENKTIGRENIIGNSFKKILYELVEPDSEELLDTLIEYVNEAKLWNEYLYIASSRGNIKQMKYFIKKGADDFCYALDGAKISNQKEAIELLKKEIKNEIPTLIPAILEVN